MYVIKFSGFLFILGRTFNQHTESRPPAVVGTNISNLRETNQHFTRQIWRKYRSSIYMDCGIQWYYGILWLKPQAVLVNHTLTFLLLQVEGSYEINLLSYTWVNKYFYGWEKFHQCFPYIFHVHLDSSVQ